MEGGSSLSLHSAMELSVCDVRAQKSVLIFACNKTVHSCRWRRKPCMDLSDIYFSVENLAENSDR